MADLLRSQAAAQSDGIALLAPGRSSLSYAALWEEVQDLACRLDGLGLNAQSRVAVVLPNGPEMATCFLGVSAFGVCAPLNPGYTAAEFRFYLEDIRAQAVILSQDEGGPIRALAAEMRLPVLQVAIDARAPAGHLGMARRGGGAGATFAREQDTALILHTSGTTARPKIVPLSQANLLASANNIARHLALTPSDRCLNVMPLFHIHGLIGALLASVAHGASVICAPGFDESSFFAWISAQAPTWYTAVPTIHQAVAAHGENYARQAPGHRFRFVRSSSSALPPNTFEALRALTGAPVIEAYGMTEASHQMASNPLPPRACKPGSVGLPAGVDIALMDETGSFVGAGVTGEIVIRGPGVMAGYENNPNANAQALTDGWFRTGDQGRFDDEGYLYISGRLKEIVNRAGEKISPREIDEVLLEHPEVAQAIAFAVPHPTLGEDLAAAVVLRPGATVDEAGLRGFLFGRLADFKVPSAIVLTDAIPKGATGKIQRNSLHGKLGGLLTRTYVAPATATEQALQAIFGAVLGAAEVGIHHNFFALGGDSLKGAQVVARINAQLGLTLAVGTLFQHPTIAGLALMVDAGVRESAERAAALEAELSAEIANLSDEEVARLLASQETKGP